MESEALIVDTGTDDGAGVGHHPSSAQEGAPHECVVLTIVVDGTAATGNLGIAHRHSVGADRRPVVHAGVGRSTGGTDYAVLDRG